MDGLRRAGQQQYLSLGLLARAAYSRNDLEFEAARADLQEVFNLAEPSGMLLYLADAHLESARLDLAEATAQPSSTKDKEVAKRTLLQSAQTHTESAARIIQQTGYMRRMQELQTLRHALLPDQGVDEREKTIRGTKPNGREPPASPDNVKLSDLKTSTHTNRPDNTAVDILLICVLKDEYAQVLKVADGLMAPGWEERSETDGWIVADGRFSTSQGIPLNIRAACASYMGREQVQALAGRLIQAQQPRCIAMSGVCAGRRGKVALGDVIFAERLWSYDAGKTTVEDGKVKFQGDILAYRPSPVWVQRMQSMTVIPNSPWLKDRPALSLEYQEDWVLLRLLAGEEPSQHPDFKIDCPQWSEVLARLWKRQWLKPSTLEFTPVGRERAEELKLLYQGRLPKPKAFQIHVAPMASGSAVVEDEGIFPRLADSMRKILGIDMEASGLGALGEIQGIPVLVAKGVQDYGDSFKDDRYRTFAARAAAECLIALLRKNADLLPNRRETILENQNPSSGASMTDIPRDLIDVLAEEYPSVRDARALWQRAGGKAREVEDIPRPFDLWQRLWLRSTQGAAARPEALLRGALEDLPNNAVLLRHLAVLQAQ